MVAERLNSPLQVNRVVGAVLDKGSFGFGVPVGGVLTELRKIYPKSTLESCKKFAPTSTFTKQLQDCLHSDMEADGHDAQPPCAPYRPWKNHSIVYA